MKDSYALNYLSHMISFGIQFKFDNLIRHVIEIQSLELQFCGIFFKLGIAFFIEWRKYVLT